MRYILNIGAIITLFAALSACATQRPVNYLDAQARPLIKQVDSVLIVPQDALEANIKASKISLYAQGHFVPVLLDVGINLFRTYTAHQIITPINETLVEYDYKHQLKKELNVALADSNIDGVGELKILHHEPLGFRASFVKDSEADAVMFIDVKYAFTPNFDALYVSSSVMVFPVNPELSPYKEKPDFDDILEVEDNIYRNQFLAVVPVGDDVGTKSENGDVWEQMSEAELSYRMEAAAIKLSNVIAENLRIDDLPDATTGDITDAVEVIPERQTTALSPAPFVTPETEIETGS